MAAQKRLKGLIGNAIGAPDGDMRMKRLKIRFESRRKDRVLNVSVQCEEMWVALTDTDPNHRRTVARIEHSHSAQRQKKRCYPDSAQNLAQPIASGCFHLSQKTERQMKLVLRKPAQTSQIGVKPEEY
jgi:hypothetical protein